MNQNEDMLIGKISKGDQKGFVLLGMVFMMIIMAVTAMALNRRAGLQQRMAANQAHTMKIHAGQMATTEQTVWKLTRDPCWRTVSDGEEYFFSGVTFNRRAISSPISGYRDAVTVTVTPSGGQRSVRSSFRYYMGTAFLAKKPNQISVDGSDNLYFADSDNHSIWKIEAPSGAITRVAGNSTSGYSGDGGLAVEAQLDSPMGVHVDTSGNIYIADTENHRIRKVNTFGYISTVAGSGTPDFSGDGGAATSAELNKPKGVFVDTSGNIYIADTENHCVRRVDGVTKLIETVAGIGEKGGFEGDGGPATSAKLRKPYGVFVNASGDIYIADKDNHCIRKVDEATQDIDTVAGIGTSGGYEGDGDVAISAKLRKPRGVFIDDSGDIYIADTDNSVIRKVDASGIIDTIAGSGTAGYSGDGAPATSAELDHPGGVCLSNEAVVIADTTNGAIRSVDLAALISTLNGTGIPTLNTPGRIAMDGSGNIYIADRDNHRVQRLDTNGGVSVVAGNGSAGYSGDSGQATSAELNKPEGVALDTAGNIYIADTENNVIRKVDTSGDITTVAGTGSGGYSGDGGPATGAKLDKPEGVFVDSSGNIFIADTENNVIRKVDSSGNIDTVAGTGTAGYSEGGPATSAKIKKPEGVFVDSLGNIYIADTGNHLIRFVNAGNGFISDIVGDGTQGYSGDGGPAADAQLNNPSHVFVDTPGNIFIADKDNNRIRVVSVHDGKINNLAGLGTSGFNGDEKPAIEGQLNKPVGVAMASVRGGRKIYISDMVNNRLRFLYLKIIPELY